MLREVVETWCRKLILFGVFNIFLGLTIGFGLGVYSLPILTAETYLNDAGITARQSTIEQGGEFHRNLEGSDSLHRGEGTIREKPWLATMLSG